jgi:hypothetical protein
MQEGTGRWIKCVWIDEYYRPHKIPRQEGIVVPGVFLIPPPIMDITFHDGLWTELNSKLGTLFDIAEEEWISPDSLPAMAAIITDFVKSHYAEGSGSRTVLAGQRIAPQPGDIIAEAPLADLRRFLQMLVEFLNDAVRQEKVVVISL